MIRSLNSLGKKEKKSNCCKSSSLVEVTILFVSIEIMYLRQKRLQETFFDHRKKQMISIISNFTVKPRTS